MDAPDRPDGVVQVPEAFVQNWNVTVLIAVVEGVLKEKVYPTPVADATELVNVKLPFARVAA
jgi:hypothetical protein